MWNWPAAVETRKSGDVDELLPIAARPGVVEIMITHDNGIITMRIPAELVDEVIARLAAARDAAALMAIGRKMRNHRSVARNGTG